MRHICNERKEREPICLCTNEMREKNLQCAAFAMRERNESPFVYAQIKMRTTFRRRNKPTGRNRLRAIQLNAADWLVRLRSVVLSLSQAFSAQLKLFWACYFHKLGAGKALVIKARGLNVLSRYSVFDL